MDKNVGKGAHYMRTQKLYPLEGIMCERCREEPARERHHVDSDISNNDPNNIMFLCRNCHTEVDGRRDRFAGMARTGGQAAGIIHRQKALARKVREKGCWVGGWAENAEHRIVKHEELIDMMVRKYMLGRT